MTNSRESEIDVSDYRWLGAQLAIRLDGIPIVMSGLSVKGKFWVYVIELDPTGFENVGAGVVYVGETAKTPEERFATHVEGGLKASRKVTGRAIRLRPDLYPPEGPFSSREEARRYERKTRNRLVHRGFRVFGGQGEAFMKPQRRNRHTPRD